MPLEKKRTVFGRRKVGLDKTAFLIELRKDSLMVRELWSRRERSVRLEQLIDLVIRHNISENG
jgi:hypothetical protein